MNQLDTSEEKLLANRGHDLFYSDDGDTTSQLSEPHTHETPFSPVCSDPDGSDDGDDSDDDDGSDDDDEF
jgi:hypothetical protein